MSSLPKVAVAGAGNMGIPIIRALLDSKKYQVTVLSRNANPESSYGDKVPNDPNLSFATVDYNSVSSLTEAIQGHLAVVSTLTTTGVDSQKSLIDAAVAAKVSRFIPSEFGSDTTNPNGAKLPVFRSKLAIAEMIEGHAKNNPSFTYTLIINGPFLDWGLEHGIFLNTKGRSGTIYNGGDVPFSTSTLNTIAKAVVGVLNNLDATKNRAVRVHDAVITQNQILEVAKRANANGEPWILQESTTDAVREDAYAKLAGGKQEDIWPAMMGFLISGIFGGDAYGSDFGKIGVDNELLGVPTMSGKEVEEVIHRYV